MPVERVTVDLTGYPDLVVIYLGMRVNALRGIGRLARLGPQISAAAAAARSEGLLGHEFMLFSLFPLHVGFRQYWRDLDSMMTWTRAQMHDGWWKDFLRDPAGTGFWHETYRIGGGIEAIYDDMPAPVGLAAFAPRMAAKGSMGSARDRLANRPKADLS